MPAFPMLRSSLALVVAVWIAVLVSACGGTDTAGEPTTPAVQTPTTAAQPSSAEASAPAPPALHGYQGSLYTARVPTGWTQEAADESHPGYLESKWRDPTDSMTSITIDASAGESTPPASKANEVRAAVSHEPSYHDIAMQATTIASNEGYAWTFDLSGSKRVDYFTNTCSTGIAVLGSTSPGLFHELSATFKRVADSVKVDCTASPGATGSSSTNPPTSTAPSNTSTEPPDFCATHDCIPSFDKGTGYIVQCNDGMWSHSGGRPGACSYHDGESSTTYP